MKKKLTIGALFLGMGIVSLHAQQQVPTFTSPVPGGVSSTDFWSRVGNSGTGSATNNLLGTRWNSPIYFITGGVNNYRMKLNGDMTSVTQYAINGFGGSQGVNTSGYLLLGADNISVSNLSGPTMYQNKGAFSLLHLNGNDAGYYQEYGFRPWMKTGITFTGNQDLAYVGYRELGTDDSQDDFNEMVVAWSDNENSVDFGSDDMAFRFLKDAGGSISTNFETAGDLDGLHVARFTYDGSMGLGNTFGLDVAGMAPGYVRPASLFHMSHTANAGRPDWGFMQVTYRGVTGETANDGLRHGIGVSGSTPTGYLRWQENTPYIMQTDWDNTAGGTDVGERVRISSVNAPGVPANAFITANSNTTRMSVSYTGSAPLNAPRALLHLGANISTGYAAWMDYGTLTSSSNRAIFMGITPAAYTVDPSKAVLGFGGSDLLFMHATIGEVGRFNQTTGNMGIGAFGPLTVNGVPTHRLDVIGNARFRQVPDNNAAEYLLLGKRQNPSDPADIELQRLAFTGNSNQVLLGNGTWGNAPAGGGGGFVVCTDNTGAANLTADSKVNLNDYNLFFEGNGQVGANLIGIGYSCADPLTAKVNVFSKNEVWNSIFYTDNSTPVDINFQGGIQSSIDFTRARNATAVQGLVAPNASLTMDSQIGVHGEVKGASVKEAIGVYGKAAVSDYNSGALGGRFLSSGSAAGRAVQAQVTAASSGSFSGFAIGGDFNAQGNNVNSLTGAVGSANGTNAASVTGVRGTASAGGNSTSSIGVFGNASGGSVNRAGYFAGDLETTAAAVITSDQKFKTDVKPIGNALEILEKLNPKTYYMDTRQFGQFHFSETKQFGFIAQEVETVLPELVHRSIHPGETDAEGKTLVEPVEYKSLNYIGLIPVNTQAIKELNQKQQQTEARLTREQGVTADLARQLEQKEQHIQNLESRLARLESCLSHVLPQLCQINQSAVETNSPEIQEGIRRVMDVELGNRIVLNQNVPNPFAESTVITYAIPAAVKNARLCFYDERGQVIRTVEIAERGTGQLNVFAQDLSSGAYTYALWADGVMVASKKMLKTN